MTRVNESDPLFRGLDPRNRQFLSAHTLPEGYEPLLDRYDVTAVALVPFASFPHLKTLPTWQMMVEDDRGGRYNHKHTLVVPSSGNTAHAAALLGRAFGFSCVKAVVASDVPSSKKAILAALASVEVISPSGRQSVADRAQEEARRAGHYLLDQYTHPGNARAHQLYTGPEVHRAASSKLFAVAAPMGSCGTICGLGNYFLNQRALGREVGVVGVQPRLGEQVPGARDKRRVSEVVTLPWREVTDQVVEVSRKDAFVEMRRLWQVLTPQVGPSSAMAWCGLRQFVQGLTADILEQLAGSTIAFVCPDDGRFYSDVMLAELDPDQGLRAD